MLNEIVEKVREVLETLELGIRDFIENLKTRVPAPPSPTEEEVARMKPITPSEVKGVPEKYIKQVGVLKAEIAKLKQENQRLRQLIERLKEEKRKELIRMIEERREFILQTKLGEMIDIRKIPRDVKVFSKDHKFLGWFYSIYLGDGNLHVIVSEEPNGRGRKFRVWSGPSLGVLVHHAENIAEQLRNRILILNRTYSPPVYVPDIDVYMPLQPYVKLAGGKVLCTLCGKILDSMEEFTKHFTEKHAGGGGRGG